MASSRVSPQMQPPLSQTVYELFDGHENVKKLLGILKGAKADLSETGTEMFRHDAYSGTVQIGQLMRDLADHYRAMYIETRKIDKDVRVLLMKSDAELNRLGRRASELFKRAPFTVGCMDGLITWFTFENSRHYPFSLGNVGSITSYCSNFTLQDYKETFGEDHPLPPSLQQSYTREYFSATQKDMLELVRKYDLTHGTTSLQTTNSQYGSI
jgi:hypothetical protein